MTVHADAPAGSDVRVGSSGTPALTAALTFTTGNWDEPQAFTVTAVDDADSADDSGLAISHRVAGADYQGLMVRRGRTDDPWLARMLACKPRMLVAVALANRMARIVWALMTKKEIYRAPALEAA